MQKRVLSVLLALALMLSLLPVSALAADTAEVLPDGEVAQTDETTPDGEVAQTDETTPDGEVAQTDEPTPDGENTKEPVIIPDTEVHYAEAESIPEPFGEKVYPMVSLWGTRGGSFTGTTYYEQLDAESQDIYDRMKTAFSEPGTTTFVVTKNADRSMDKYVVETRYDEKTAQLETYTSAKTITEIKEWFDPLVEAAFSALVYDHPEMPWLRGSATNWSTRFSYSAVSEKTLEGGRDGEKDTIYTGVTITEVTFSIVGPAVTTSQQKTTFESEVNKAVTSLQSSTAGKSRYDTVKAIHDYICELNTYDASSTPPVNQTAYSSFVYRRTVCAGYATAFQVLCHRFNIPCVYVTGWAGENHGWNYVMMEDGKWYAVDCTWDDQETKIYYDFFLVGSKTKISTSWGSVNESNQEFSQNHQERAWSNSYTMPYPALNASAYENTPHAEVSTVEAALKSVSPEENHVSGTGTISVPTAVQGTTTVTLSATATYTDNTTGDVTEGATWSLTAPVPAGVTLSGNVLTVSPSASAGSITVAAAYGGKSGQVTITLAKAAAVVTAVQVTGATSITIPDTGTNTAAYTAKVYDQYGAEMTGQAVAWTISGNSTGITMEGGTITVASTAADHQNVTLTATAGGKSGSVEVSINKLPPHTVTAMEAKTFVFGSTTSFTQKVGHTCCTTAAAYSSSDPSVATVDANGKVAIVGCGVTTITATIPATASHAATTASYQLTVSQASITGATVTVTETCTYNGSAQTPAVTVKLGTKTLVKDTDYTVSYTDNTNAGTATATVTGKGNYAGTAARTFTIARATLKPSIGGILTKVYDGTTNAPGALIVLSGIIGDDDVTATAAFAYNSANAGARTITASNITLTGGKSGNYSLSETTATASGTITKKAQDAPSAPTAADADIKDTSITLTTIPGAEYSRDGTNWQDSPTFTGLSPNTEYTFYARLKADDNRTASDPSEGAAFKTKKTMLSGAMVTVSGTFTYNGAAQTPAAEQVTVKLGGAAIGRDQYTISASNNTNAGTATVTITAADSGNYSGSASGTFTISPATPTIAWGITTQELTYSGSPAAITAPTVTLVKDEEFSGTITYSYAVGTSTKYTAGLPTNAGTYTIKASIAASGNYSAAQSTNTLTLTIKKSEPAIAFKDSYKPDRDYNGAAIANPTADDLTVTGAQFSAVKFAWTKDGKAATPTSAGTYTLTASIAETTNTAAVSVTKEVTISKAAITVTPDAGQHKEYGAADPTLTYKITGGKLFGSDKLSGKLAYEGTNVGKYEITQGTLAATANYTLTVASGVMFEITKPTLENATVTLSAGSYTYDGAAKTPTVTVKKGTQTLDAGEYDITYSNTNGGAGNHTNAGTVTVTVSAKEGGNYHGSKSAVFVISPKAVTAVVTAENKVFDGTNRAVVTAAVKESDLASGDSITIAGLTGTFDSANAGTGKRVTVNRTNASITGDGVGNYTVTIPATATASITRATVTIAWASEAQTQTVGYTGSQAVITAPTVSAQNDVTVSVTPKYSYAPAGSSTFTSGLPTNAGTYTVRASIAESGNLTAASADMTLTISPKTVGSPVITLSASTFVYDGQPKTPTVTIRDGGKVIPASEYEVVYEDNTDVGTATVTIRNVAGNYSVSGSVTFSITEKPLTGAAVNVSGTFSYTGAAHTPVPTVALSGKTLVKDTDYTVGYADNTDAGTATITITGKGNYSGEVKKTFTIAKATLTADGDGTASGTYGAKLSELTVAGLAAKLGDAPVAGTWNLTGSTIPNVGDSGTYTAIFTPASGAGNYNTLTAPVKLSIAKANYSGAKTANTSAKSGSTATYALAALLPKWGVPGAVSVSGDIFEETPGISSSSVSYKLSADAAVNSTGTIMIPVTSTNYNDFSLTITVTVADKDVPTLTVSAITVTYNGQAVPNTAIRGTAKVGNTTVLGTWAFAAGQGLTDAADSGIKTVIFTPNDAVMYAEVEGTVTVTINKATPTGAPKYTAVSASGKTLDDAALTAPDSWPAGTLAWELPTDTGVTANTAYKWTFTPDNANYNTISGSVTLWRSSSGGGYVPSAPDTSGSSGTSGLPVSTTGQNSSAVATTTTAAPTASTHGGQATTIVDTATGNEIVKQAVANKSEDVVIAPKVTGSVTKSEVSIPAATVSQIERQTNASLTIATPVANVTIPNGGLGSLSGTGGTVTVTAEKMGSTVELSVTADGRTVTSVPGGLTLAVPVYYAAPGTVAVLVHDNGMREVVRKSVADNGSVTIPLNGSAKLEIVDNSKYFYDVPATNWAADAVAFASSHELFNGTGVNQFSPNQPMSRGMLATVLHNLESNPYQPLTGIFADVNNSAWYAEGVAWAAANGIVTGYGNGEFGPGDNITREQLAVMLWRYAGKPAAAGRELYFADAYRASDWALEALRWATQNGIINGKGSGILDPTGLATRAETAQMLKNFMKKQ